MSKSPAVVLLLLFMPLACLAAPLLLSQDGRPAASIVAGDEEASAAAELQTYILRISGATLPIVQEAPEGACILLGGLSQEQQTQLDLGFDGFVIRREGETLRLAGATANGTLNAVYRFLDGLGCRWYIPGEIGEVLPARPTIAFDEPEQVSRPSFLHRVIWPSLAGRGLSAEDRERFTRWCRRNLYGGVPIHVGHNFYRIAPSEEFFGQHPEWYALRGGKRDPGGQLCTTNPELIEHTARVAGQWFDKNPSQTMFSLSPDDNVKFCHCEACEALDPEEFRGRDTGMGRRLTIYANEVAERLQETHPGKNVAFYAYWGAVEAPEDVEGHPNVVVFFTPIGMAFNYALQDESSPVNVKHNEWYDGWRKVARQMGIRHYYNFSSVLWIPWKELAAELRYQHENRALYVNAELWADSEGSALSYYVLSRLLWDVDADPQAAFEEFVSGLYGAAQEPMRRYYSRLSDRWSNCGREILWPNALARQAVFLEVLTPEVLADCRADLAEAARLAGEDETLRARVHISEVWLDYMTAWRDYAAAMLGETEQPVGLMEKVRVANRLLETVEALKPVGPGALPEIEQILLREARKWARLGGPREPLEPAFPELAAQPADEPPTRFRGQSEHIIQAQKGDGFTITLRHYQVGTYQSPLTYTVVGPDGEPVAEGTVDLEEQQRLEVTDSPGGTYAVFLAAGSNAASIESDARYLCTNVETGAQPDIITHARPLYFTVKQGVEQFTLSMLTAAPAETVQLGVFNPKGDRVADELVAGQLDLTIRVPAGMSGRPWSFTLRKAATGVFEDVEGVHFSDGVVPYIADAPGRLLRGR